MSARFDTRLTKEKHASILTQSAADMAVDANATNNNAALQITKEKYIALSQRIEKLRTELANIARARNDAITQAKLVMASQITNLKTSNINALSDLEEERKKPIENKKLLEKLQQEVALAAAATQVEKDRSRKLKEANKKVEVKKSVATPTSDLGINPIYCSAHIFVDFLEEQGAFPADFENGILVKSETPIPIGNTAHLANYISIYIKSKKKALVAEYDLKFDVEFFDTVNIMVIQEKKRALARRQNIMKILAARAANLDSREEKIRITNDVARWKMLIRGNIMSNINGIEVRKKIMSEYLACLDQLCLAQSVGATENVSRPAITAATSTAASSIIKAKKKKKRKPKNAEPKIAEKYDSIDASANSTSVIAENTASDRKGGRADVDMVVDALMAKMAGTTHTRQSLPGGGSLHLSVPKGIKKDHLTWINTAIKAAASDDSGAKSNSKNRRKNK